MHLSQKELIWQKQECLCHSISIYGHCGEIPYKLSDIKSLKDQVLGTALEHEALNPKQYQDLSNRQQKKPVKVAQYP